MSSNSWEKVGKTKTKTKTQKREVADRMPRQNVEVAPLQVSKSMFDAIDNKTRSDPKQPLQDRSNAQASPKGKNKPRKQKKPPSPGFRHNSFEDAIKDVAVLSVYDRANELRKSEQVWQKAIILMINDTISCPEESTTFSHKDLKYPLSKVPKATCVMMKKLFVEETSEAIKRLLFDHCLLNMELMAKDQPTWGYRLCIQILAHNTPNSCFDETEKYLDDILHMKNYPKRCLAKMWAVGQVGVGHLRTGIKVWLDVMLPVLGTKNLAQFVVHYLETLIALSSNPRKDLSGTINADQFVQIMKWTFDPTTSLSSNLRDRLRSVYSTICLIATGDAERKLSIFEKFLRTPVDEIMRIKGHFLEVAFESMRENPKCLQSWSDRSTYSSSLPQTKLLLEDIESKWEVNARKLPRNFETTIRTFHNINTDAAAQSDPMTSVKEFKTVKSLCQGFLQKLQKKLHQIRSRCNNVLLSIVVIVIAIAIGLFLYDVNLHGGTVEKSATYKTLKSTGTLSFLERVWRTVSSVLQVIGKWLEKHVPYYWSRVSDALGPYVYYLAVLLGKSIQWLLDITEPIRTAIADNIEAILIWADKMFRDFLPGAVKALQGMAPYFSTLSKWIDAKALAIYSLVSGEMGWCCVRDATVGYTIFFYESAFAVLYVVWSYLQYLFKMASDYVSGENMQ